MQIRYWLRDPEQRLLFPCRPNGHQSGGVTVPTADQRIEDQSVEYAALIRRSIMGNKGRAQSEMK